ncbi:MAG: hypothetical protein QXF35_02945 [Candidatus Bilamarchaeaceae archaeon]
MVIMLFFNSRETQKEQVQKNKFKLFSKLKVLIERNKDNEKNKSEQSQNKETTQTTKKTERVSIAKEEKKKSSTYINLVDIALDGYDDIFSDFDPSPYSKRELSKDFVKEVERRYSLTRGGQIEVVFSLPKKLRNTKDEATIKERIREYFQWKMNEVEEEAIKKQKLGGLLIGVGVVFITISNIIGLYSENSFFLKILHEITLVPGWVGEFVGIEKLLLESNEIRQKKAFYEKFRDAIYIFVSEEDVVKKMADAITPQKESENKEQKKMEL